ncbi:biotin-independent malonate decarboxylase subunit beta [Ferrovum sp. PN-J185]|uniref:biotin-independent malonate decarboxylase subunit beta n=1 Tax=Ferrovum sp. PN-J185 TaxID=1356306 RepID=UPI000792AA62|nr:biotin-independent malonate decarboxylase subunit beta [Ferrovum sp. PN-J185]KXW55309.1 malonyl-S-ACP:biotin-protein carboxyltransferase MADC [Ferrovum sp. PN-J185]MCC6068626.1 biotin-independent malonate decarboxylase subunit beta [Ferrovum sp. PN-J185]MDE2056006.1 biotin-independent malonate decarboxylase subunit beta [Betaproteobacteria bacterium]
MNSLKRSYREASARQRISGLCDLGSFNEWLGPVERLTSPHLEALGAPLSFDDGVVVGEGTIMSRKAVMIAQEGLFNGGAVGEVHGAKIRGALLRAVTTSVDYVVFAVDSGGVRLHEANAGLIAISEIMRALFSVQQAGIPVIALVGGSCGAFGGMGIVTRLCDVIVMSEEGRMGLSGPEVIETVKGVDEFDAKDRALVWRVTGGKIRRTLNEAQVLVEDSIPSFRAALEGLIVDGVKKKSFAVDELMRQQQDLLNRSLMPAHIREGSEVWASMGLGRDEVSLMSVAQFNQQLAETTHD